MKTKIFTIIMCLLVMSFSIAQAQDYQLSLHGKMLKNFGGLKKGNEFALKELVHETSKAPGAAVYDNYFVIDGTGKKTAVNGKIDDCFSFDFDNKDQFWDAQVVTTVLDNLSERGMQTEMRKELEDESLEFISRMRMNGLILEDTYLETYLYSILNKLAPSRLIDGRPCVPNLVILQSPLLNASSYPNGTIVLYTGLLAALHSEDELAAILAHELAHFVLDHTVMNINKAKDRAKRAEFWANFATAMAAAGDIALSYKSRNYVPGALTLSTAAISYSIANTMNERMGMKYNHEQEEEADLVSKNLLHVAGYDPDAMATTLYRIQQYYLSERNYAIYSDSYTHPALSERIKKIGTVNPKRDHGFEKAIAPAVSNVAGYMYNDQRFKQCLILTAQNINNKVGTSLDHYLYGYSSYVTGKYKAGDKELYHLLEKAKSLDSAFMPADRLLIVLKIQAGDKEVAQKMLTDYMNQFMQAANSMDESCRQEIQWAKDMLARLPGL